jgi:hypothetical protein
VSPLSGVYGAIRCKLATRISPPAHEAERAVLVANRQLSEVAPPSLDRIDLVTLPLAGSGDYQHFSLTRIEVERGHKGAIDKAARRHIGELATNDLGGRPAKARK